jgi:hypothetical protein
LIFKAGTGTGERERERERERARVFTFPLNNHHPTSTILGTNSRTIYFKTLVFNYFK